MAAETCLPGESQEHRKASENEVKRVIRQWALYKCTVTSSTSVTSANKRQHNKNKFFFFLKKCFSKKRIEEKSNECIT